MSQYKYKSQWTIYRIKNKKAAINPINKYDNKCFQYSVTLALNQKEIDKNSERITKSKLFIDKYNWKGTNYPSEKDDWKNEKNHFKIVLHILYTRNEKIYPACVSEHNSKLKDKFQAEKIKQSLLYCSKKLSTLLIGITSFIVWIVFIYLEQKKLE